MLSQAVVAAAIMAVAVEQVDFAPAQGWLLQRELITRSRSAVAETEEAQERQRILPATKDQILYFQLLPQLAAARAAALHPTAATAVLVAAGAGDSERAQAAQEIRLVHRQAKAQMAAAAMLVAVVVAAHLPLAQTLVARQRGPLVAMVLLHLFLEGL